MYTVAVNFFQCHPYIWRTTVHHDTLKWAVMLNHTSPWSEQTWCIFIGLLLHFCCGTCVGRFSHTNYGSGQALLGYSSLLKLLLARMYRNALPSVAVLDIIFLICNSLLLPKASIMCLCMHVCTCKRRQSTHSSTHSSTSLTKLVKLAKDIIVRKKAQFCQHASTHSRGTFLQTKLSFAHYRGSVIL